MGYYTNKVESLALVEASIAYIDARGPMPSMPAGYLKPKPLTAKRDPGGPSDWLIAWSRFEKFLNTGIPQFEIIGEDGNGKLPFRFFSACPDVTCPGAGDCLSWCYSFKAWRYPFALFKQLQNTLLLRTESGREHIKTSFNQIPYGLDFRLYVDGDIDSIETMGFWFGLLERRPDIRVYGYSKSWKLFLLWDKLGKKFPANYQLNASSGSKYGPEVLEKIKKLSCYRGTFDALPVSHQMPDKATKPKSWQAWAQELRNTARGMGYGRVFVCPGKCGSCTPRGHACGSARFKNIPIVIGTH
jgi:hypothetical protein